LLEELVYAKICWRVMIAISSRDGGKVNSSGGHLYIPEWSSIPGHLSMFCGKSDIGTPPSVALMIKIVPSPNTIRVTNVETDLVRLGQVLKGLENTVFLSRR